MSLGRGRGWLLRPNDMICGIYYQFGTVPKLLSHFLPQRFGRVPNSPYEREVKNLTESEESLSLEADKSMLSRRMSNPRVLDLQRARRALVYLMHTAHSGVTFHGSDEEEIIGWAKVPSTQEKEKERTATDIDVKFNFVKRLVNDKAVVFRMLQQKKW